MGRKTPPFPEYPTWTTAMINKPTEDLIIENSFPEPNSGCWFWTKNYSSNGYGQVSIKGKMRTAHRVSYEAFKEDPDALWVLHKCDNKSCVNPDHLYLGTARENTRDSVERGHHRKGMYCPWTSRITYQFAHESGVKITCAVNELCTKYNLDKANVWRMVKGNRPSAYGWRIGDGR